MSGWRALDVVAPGVGYAMEQSKKQGQDVKNRPGIATPGAAPAPRQAQSPLTPDATDQYAPSRFGNRAAGSGGATRAPEGFDFASPGVAEQYWNQQQNRTTEPGQANQYWNQVQGQFNMPTRSSQVADAGTAAFYDRAAQKTQEQMQRAQAASGTLGSSVGQENMMDALAGLRAQEAMGNAQFGLQAAGQADQAGLAQLGLGGQMAGMVDSGDLSRFNSGINAAMAAQDARRTRGRDMVGDVYAPSAALAGMAGQTYDAMFNQDQALMDAAMAAELGLSREMLNQSYMKADRQKDDEKHGMGMAKDFMSFWGGGGMGG